MSERYDVGIIGGGLVGAALAWMLTRDGARVTLLERDQVGQHASGQNAGSLHLQLENRLLHEGPERTRTIAGAIPLHLYSREIWRRLDAEFGAGIGLKPGGGLMVAETQRQADSLGRVATLEREFGLPIHLLDQGRVRAAAPYLHDGVVAATFCPLEGSINTRTAATVLAGAAAGLGARICTGTEVVALEAAGMAWRLVSRPVAGRTGPAGRRDDHVTCKAVVVAAGIWSSTILASIGIRLAISVVALMMTVTARRRPFIPHLVQHASERLTLKQTTDGTVLIGGGWPARPASRPGDPSGRAERPELLRDSLTGNLRVAARLVPEVADLPVLRTWTGTTGETEDHLPVIGPVPGRPGVFVATAGQILTLGPGAARTLTDLLGGGVPDVDLGMFSLDRFGAVR